jgi:N-acetylneuraminic acid mutarotase
LRRPLQPAIAALLAVVAGCSGAAATPPALRQQSVDPTPPVSRAASPAPALRVHALPRLPHGLSRAVAVRSGGHVLVLAGLVAGDVSTGDVISLDLRGGGSRVVGRLGLAVHDACGALLHGTAFVFGGGAATEESLVQGWRAGHAIDAGRLPAPRSDSQAATIGPTAYVVGGFDGHTLARTVEDTTDGAHFRVAGRLRQGVRYPAVAAYDGSVWVIGGERATTEGTSSGPESDLVQRFDPATGRTSVVGRLPESLGHAMAFVVGGRLYVAGGRHHGVARSRIWRIEPTGRSVRAGRLPRAFSDAAVVPAGRRVLLIGGETSGPQAPLSTVYTVG